MPSPGANVVATNRRARRQYELHDTFEAGLVLRGSEVKSLRESKVQLAESFARIDDGEAWLIGLHIAPYTKTGDQAFGHDADRPKKLLLHRHELDRIKAKLDQEPLTLVPLSLYFTGGRAKVELALGRGRKLHDRRQQIARRDADREAQRAIVCSRRR